MKKTVSGFTIVELVLMITIIGILSTIAIVGFGKVQSNARDSQRSSQIEVLSQSLEKYYERNGEYPDCTSMTATPSTVVSSTLKGMDPEILTAPNATQGTNSITSCINNPTANTFSYIPANGGYTLKYVDETSGGIISKVSRHALYVAIADNFNRTGSTLGTTSTGGKAWTVLVGSWTTNGTIATTSTAPSSNPFAVIDTTYDNIDTSVGTSASGGGDALIIRATNSTNYIRARYYHTNVGTTVPGYCTIGSWIYQGQVYTENWSPGSTIPGYDKIGGHCLPYDEWPNFNGNGAAQTYTYVTSTHVTCDPPYVNVCYWGNSYWRSVVDTPDSTTYTQHYFIYLEKVVNGVATTLYSGELASGVSNIRLKAVDSTITMYLNGSSTPTATVTESFNSNGMKHGIGRAAGGDYSTSALDNYNLTRTLGN